MSPGTDRISSYVTSWPGDIDKPYCIYVEAPNNKFINMLVHDCRQGYSLDFASGINTEVYGNLVFNNGWIGPDRGHGHGLYVQNPSGYKRITNSFIFGGYSHGIHGYGTSEAFLNGFEIRENSIWDGGFYARGGGRASRVGGGNSANIHWKHFHRIGLDNIPVQYISFIQSIIERCFCASEYL
jgi:hypothetical protein